MKNIKGVTFGFMTHRGEFADERAQASLKTMVEETGCDTVLFTLAALQDTAHSEAIDYQGKHMPADEELKEMCNLAKTLGLRIIIKPLVNCRNGVWRAHINFFEHDVVCEPKWSNWFQNYTAYQLHYAQIAQEVGAELFVIGCEMVQSERREQEWRKLIADVRKVYSGLITYNTDKYQEDHVTWWDCVDVISSSGYYPIHDWNRQLARIKAVVDKYQKPFFFAEVGCPAREGSNLIPNDWTHQGRLDLLQQACYYEVLFKKCCQESWIKGFGIWDWNAQLYEKKQGILDDGYAIYGKPACIVVKQAYNDYND